MFWRFSSSSPESVFLSVSSLHQTALKIKNYTLQYNTGTVRSIPPIRDNLVSKLTLVQLASPPPETVVL